MVRNVKLRALVALSFLFFALPMVAGAFSVGEVQTFNVETSYDSYSRNELSATLHRVTNEIFFYVEEDWWNELSDETKGRLDERMYNASVEFERKILPQLTSIFGFVPNHPVDKSGRITVLFHRMPAGAGGYINTGDQYSVLQNRRSNERNMLYINTFHIEGDVLESFLAHELVHLITFNEKERTHGVTEEIWLNEARAEYAPTLLGYDGGNIERRISSFLRFSETSLTEWRNSNGDYGVVNIFIHYLVDHYGVEILADSLKSNKVGIESINEALIKNGYSENFSDIFTDWAVASFVNDCNLEERYCYINPELTELKVVPWTTYLPASYGSSYSARNSARNWSGGWYRIIGGKGDLKFEFEGESGTIYNVSYILCDTNNSCKVESLFIDSQGKGSLTISGFGERYDSFTFIPSVQSKTSGFNGVEREKSFTWRVSAGEPVLLDNRDLIRSLLIQIEELQFEIQRLQSLTGGNTPVSCDLITENLAFGLRGDRVSCLQEFLRVQGPDIYPEGLVTGNFFSLTRDAVIRFQERYASEILHPLGLQRGTGYVGESTRRKINEILSS